MRLGVNAAFAGDNFNGVTTLTVSLVDSLVDAGHEVYVYSSSNQLSAHRRVTLRKTPPRLRSQNGTVGNLARLYWTNTSLPAQLKSDRVDLLITSNHEGILRSAIPQIVTVHDVIPMFYKDENPRQRYMFKYALPAVLARSAGVLVDSEYTKEDVIRLYGVQPDRLAVAFGGLKEDLFEDQPGVRPTGHPENPYFLFVGTFSPRKNLVTVLHAFAAIAGDVPEKLVIVAYPDRWMNSALQLAAQLRVRDRLVLYQGLPDAELSYLRRNATALILLSEYEGLGLPPLEAMAVGTPAIASDSTSLAEVTGDAAIQVSCKDVAAAAAAMRALSQSPALRDFLRAKGKQQARKYDRHHGREQIDRALRAFAGNPIRETPL